VLVVFERRTGEPVMFHMAFKAGYTHDIVLHLGLVMVTPAHQGRHLQRLCMVNMALACLSYYTLGYIMTDIAASPSATKQVGDHMTDCFPNYRHNCNPDQGGGPLPWQLAVARFMVRYHRADFGTSPAAVLDEKTLVVRGSNAGEGGAAVLVEHFEKRRSRAARPNAFVESLLGTGPTPDEILHVGRASLPAFVWGAALRGCKPLRCAVMAIHLLRLMPALVPAALGRPDACLARFRAYCARTRFSIQLAGAPAPEPGGVLWVCNHYSWLDYPVLQCASDRLLRVVARADLGAEGVFGAMAQKLMRALDVVIEYRRGDKGSGAAVRDALRGALTERQVTVLLFPEGTSRVSGPPGPFRTGGMQVAFETGRPVQAVALWYSEPLGLAPQTDALEGTANMLRFPTQCVVKFGAFLWPKDYATADEFAAACEQAVRDAYSSIAVDGVEAPAAGVEDDGSPRHSSGSLKKEQ
jgi:1-acyl-sn-glycerol-3-phosphate acyltransferase